MYTSTSTWDRWDTLKRKQNLTFVIYLQTREMMFVIIVCIIEKPVHHFSPPTAHPRLFPVCLLCRFIWRCVCHCLFLSPFLPVSYKKLSHKMLCKCFWELPSYCEEMLHSALSTAFFIYISIVCIFWTFKHKELKNTKKCGRSFCLFSWRFNDGIININLSLSSWQNYSI